MKCCIEATIMHYFFHKCVVDLGYLRGQFRLD